MKPTWIVLLLVSLALHHPGQSDDNSEGKDKEQMSTVSPDDPKRQSDDNSEGKDKEQMSTVSPDDPKIETSQTVTTPAATRNSSANGSSATETPRADNSSATVKPTIGSDTNNSSIIFKPSEEMPVNISNQTTATPSMEQPNDQNKDSTNSSNSKDEGAKSPPSGPTASTQGPSVTIPAKETGVEDQLKEAETDRRILWILLPVLGVLVAGVLFVLKFKCMKVSDHAEPTENGTENASFQRSDNNKDNVMLVGVTTSGGEENVAAR